MVLGREDVARSPAHIGPKGCQGFNQNTRLDGHVQAAGNPCPLQGLGRAEFLTQRHQARHLGFCNHQFLAAKSRQRNVPYDKVFHLVTPDILHLHGS